MTAEISELALAIDSSQVDTGKRALDRFAKSSTDAEKASEALTKSAVLQGTAIGTVLGQAISAAGRATANLVREIDSLSKAAGAYKDLEERIGGSAESIAGLAVAAGTAGVSVDRVADFSVRLSKSLTGVDDESKAAGAALTALGIPIEAFKRLDPAAQMEQLGAALAKFKDGSGKTAVLEGLARGASDLLPFLKELNQEGGRQVILTQAQIDLADEYGDKQANLNAKLGEYAKVAAIQALPAITAIKGAAADFIGDLIGLDKATGKLAENKGIADFARTGVEALAFVVDAADGVVRVVEVLGKGIGGIGAATAALLRGNLSEAKAISADMQEEMDKILSRETFSQKLKKQFDAQQKTGAQAVAAAVDDRKDLIFDGREKKGKSKKPIDLGKEELANDIADIMGELRNLTDGYRNTQSILDAIHAAGLTDDKNYYEQKQGLIRLEAEAEVTALTQKVQALRARNEEQATTSKERLENERRIADTERQIGRVRADAEAKGFVLNLQATSSLNARTAALKSATQAAEDFLTTLRRQNALEEAAFGLSDKERNRQAARAQIEDRYAQQRQDLQNQRALAEIQAKDGQLSPEAAKQFDDRLAIIKEYQAKALAEWDDHYRKITEKEADWVNGASSAMANYVEQARNVAEQTQGIFSRAFSSMEDALVSFVTTGKLDFKSLANSILADIARIQIKASLAKVLEGSSAGGGLLGGILSLFGGGASASSGLSNAASTGNGSFWGSVSLGSPKATGGAVLANSLQQVNERGPELLQMGGKQYLMTGSEGGNVVPNDKLGGVVNNISVGAGVGRNELYATLQNFGAQIEAKILRSMRNGGAFAR